MEPKILHIAYHREFKYRLTFENGKSGVVDFKPLLFGEAFERIRKKDYFRKAFIDKQTGTITWPNGVDVAPESLLEAME